MIIAIFFITLIATLALLKLISKYQELRACKLGYITFGGDDHYQFMNIKKNIHDAAMMARIKLDIDDLGFQKLIDRIKANYAIWYHDFHKAIHPEFKKEAFCSPVEEYEQYTPYQLQDKQLLTKIVFYKQDKTILLLGNHAFLGGYRLSHFIQLIFCANYHNGIFPKNRYIPFVSELLVLRFFTQLMLSKKYTTADVFPQKTSIKRYYMKTNTAQMKADNGETKLHHAFLIMAKHVLQVMDGLKKNTLRVSLPMSFEDTATFNTVGTMFIEVDREPTLVDMANKIRKLCYKNRYQLLATNHIQRILPTRHLSAKARNRVDLTLTLVPEKALPENLIGSQLIDYEFTMENITYPVYIMAFLFEGEIHSSFIINSPSFDTSLFAQNSERITAMDLVL